VLYAGALHPPRRLLGVVAAIAVASTAPLAYDGATPERVGQVGLRVVLLCAMGLLASAVMRTVRAQRVNLRNRSDAAEREARIDELTKLHNRRAFVEALAVEISRAQRFDSPLSLVVADLDDFKRINDTFGHPAGDKCLRDVADVLRDTLRQYDACFRWGGDEFALVLPETTAIDAEIVCRRAAAAIAGCIDPAGEPLRITCAPAQLTDGMTGDDLVAAADAVLLERKNGRGLRLAHSA
jgi:diguanylate cyclase (GGDEF)-like protein